MAKFDPKYFERMRGDIKQQKEQEARIASRAPRAGPKPKDQMALTEKEVFGLRGRRDMANRVAGRKS